MKGMGLVVTAEPDWNRLPAQTRSAIQPMLQRALKKGTRPDLFHELFLRHLHVLFIEILQHGAGGGRN